MPNSLQNIAVFLLILTALVLFIAQKRNPYFFVGLGILLVVSILFPFLGLLISVPVALVVWMDNSPAVWSLWEQLKNKEV